MPFLPSEPPVRTWPPSLHVLVTAAVHRRSRFAPSLAQRGVPLKTRAVADVMATGRIVCVPEVGPLAESAEALRRTAFHAFPVLRTVEGQAAAVGIISREHLKARVRRLCLHCRGRVLTRVCHVSARSAWWRARWPHRRARSCRR